MKTSTLTFFLICFALQAAAQQPPVLINELLLLPDPTNSDPNRTYDWVELYNAGQAGVNLAGWKITAHDGASGGSARQLPSVTLPAGKYLVVRFTSGTSSLDFSSGAANYYTGDNPAAPYWNSGSDESALYSPTGIVDFIAWSRSDLTYTPGTAHNDAVNAGIWTSGRALVSDRIGQNGELLRTVTPGTSVGRDAHSTDTNSPFDFDALGGRDADDITIGRQNLDMHTFVNAAATPAAQGKNPLVAPEAQPAAAAPRTWTVMLYMNGANNLGKYWVQNIQEIMRAGGSTPAVNFVVMFAGINYLSSDNKPANLVGLIPNDPNPAPGNLILASAATLPALDMGDPATLSGFVGWAEQTYPAVHYALILAAHGDSWKYFGPDERFIGDRVAGKDPTTGNPGKTVNSDYDYLYMGEFDTALSGFHFDLVAFNSCMMSSIEVAYQFQRFTDWFVASEQTMWAEPGLDFPLLWFAFINANLNGNSNPGFDKSLTVPAQVGSYIVKNYNADSPSGRPNFRPNRGRYSLALIKEQNLPKLVDSVDTFAKALQTGSGLTQKRDDPTDNPQILISNHAQAAFRFNDENLMDLYDFANRVSNDPLLPACVKTPASQVKAVFDSGTVVAAETHSMDMDTIRGLNIYMPIFRSGGDHLLATLAGGYDLSQTYDFPGSRVTNGSSPIAVYAPNHDLLPLLARDMETGEALIPFAAIPRPDWPSLPTPKFRFVSDTSWSRFLERYYHPVADNHILNGIAPNGDPIAPVSYPGGQCSNTEDYIGVPVGSVVHLSGAGSSDADMPPLALYFNRQFDPNQRKRASITQGELSAILAPTQLDVPYSIKPPYYIWDLTPNTPCPGPPPDSPCVRPIGVAPPGSDAALTANDNMDEDRVPYPTNFDQKESTAVNPTVSCPTPQNITTNLMPWDDNHLFSFHDTNPDAQYVHPQTDSQQSLIFCLQPPIGLFFQNLPTHVAVGDSFTDTGFAYGVTTTPPVTTYTVNNYPMTVTVTGGITVSANGATVTGSGTGGDASSRAVAEAAALNSVQVLTDSGAGGLQLVLSGTQTGPASIAIHALGTNVSQTFNLNIEPRPSPAPTAIQVSASAPGAVGSTGAITAVVISGAQPVANAWVTFAGAPNIFFTNGVNFNTNHSTQVQTDSTGTANANFNASLSGAFTVTVSAGGITKTVNTSVTGTPIATPSGFSLSGVPIIVLQGAPATITATVTTPVAVAPGVNVLFTVVTGSLTVQGSTDGNKTVTIGTNANGVATMNFTAVDITPVQINASVTGLGVQTVTIGVQPSGATSPQPPAPTAVTPAAGSGLTQTVTFSFADPRGYTDLGVVNIQSTISWTGVSPVTWPTASRRTSSISSTMQAPRS